MSLFHTNSNSGFRLQQICTTKSTTKHQPVNTTTIFKQSIQTRNK